MRFGVLGPLAVWTSDGRPVRIPEVKVRALLAELVIDAGRVVPADRLIDHLWPARLPANPAAALQSRVSQLRRALEDAEPGGRALVRSHSPGYVLDVPPGAVDVRRFEDLLARARSAGSPRARADLLGEALSLWRGPALVDFADEEFARTEAARLAELRLTAQEELAEARLDLGEHALLADELGDLVARHPFRERLRAAHLRALYLAGRQREALEAYRDLRERLAEELGLDPGPELVALHRAILRRDPALRAASARPAATNLPAPVSDLIGRDGALELIAGLLGDARLVTLTGPGGVGKTRLAVEAARRLAGAFDDGVWLVELAAIPARPGDADRAVAETVAATLLIRDESGQAAREPVERLADALRDRRMLLVLDNCEHVADAAARLVSRLLRAVPGLRVLATGQRPLGVAGETLWRVPPLTEEEAVRLFAARAAPGFTLDSGNAETVAAVCRRLDGIPLAVELAATRVRTLGLSGLRARLEDRFRVLTGGHADAPARQRTLRAMIDWSWELLGEQERTVLRRLAVHADGCTLEAAEATCGEPGLDVLDLLAGLVDRSLVVFAEHGGLPRYRLLESVAAYCQERLREAGEWEEVHRRVRRHYAAFAATADVHLRGPAQREWLRRLDAEAANLRAALDDAVRHGDGDTALRLATSLAWYWVLRGRLGEGRRSLEAALALDGQSPAAVTARLWRSAFALRMGEPPGPAEPVPPAVPHRDLDDLAGRTRAQWYLAFAMLGIGEPADIEPTLAVFRAIGDQWGIAAALSTSARRALLRSDLASMREYGERSRALFTELGDQWGRLHATVALGWHAQITGDYRRAARLHREGLRMAEELGLWTEVSDALSELGRIALLTGDHAQADELHRRAGKLAAEQGYTIGQEYAALGLALSARRQGRLDEAEAHLREWLDWDRRLGSAIALALILAELGFVAEQRGDLEAARTLHEEGLEAARKTGDPRALALAFEGLAGVEAAAGAAEEAARLLGVAAALRESVGAPLPAAERGDVNRIGATARAALGERRFADAYARGRSEGKPKAAVASWAHD
ncbi:BTAD domain-containing putative transcriptional regulator [Thermoactinospora rubra]|uniref:BTAD domain-containing putative transcriptional regulator n=1 Tax=Thermoactinospora rubra TaxID=1088767 RepID=UPI000A0F44C7|nr:BTAD domain-containing putative transcriptional regulator [Thermoactinospora rubra]